MNESSDTPLDLPPQELTLLHEPDLLLQSLLQRLPGDTSQLHPIDLLLQPWRPLLQNTLHAVLRVRQTPAVRVLDNHDFLDADQRVYGEDVRQRHLDVAPGVAEHDDLAGVDAEEVFGVAAGVGAGDYCEEGEGARGLELCEGWEGLVSWEVGFVTG